MNILKSTYIAYLTSERNDLTVTNINEICKMKLIFHPQLKDSTFKLLLMLHLSDCIEKCVLYCKILLTSNREISCSIFEKLVSKASTLPVA